MVCQITNCCCSFGTMENSSPVHAYEVLGQPGAQASRKGLHLHDTFSDELKYVSHKGRHSLLKYQLPGGEKKKEEGSAGGSRS
ncbi:hypothetical protein Ccrd_008139 [Cynara cardunculus var. scolymus]|uniref:Uncharacterized protein n=1 Tax=Cynara cardunculus var. scolymus TaxID=59895 RepID=A0A103XFS9_CYNCS|nr:hypothetical protein Ccrd_008139 [Cynara cardunculus var. scolymus]